MSTTRSSTPARQAIAARVATLRLQRADIDRAIAALDSLERLKRARVVPIDRARRWLAIAQPSQVDDQPAAA